MILHKTPKKVHETSKDFNEHARLYETSFMKFCLFCSADALIRHKVY